MVSLVKKLVYRLIKRLLNQKTFDNLEYSFSFRNRKQFKYGQFSLLHRGNKSDLSILRATFKNEDYSMSFCSQGRQLYEKTKASNGVILDLGAHIGISMAYFKSIYPNAKLIGVEPSDENFDYLTKNTKAFQSDVTLHQGLVGFEQDTMPLYDNANEQWAYSAYDYTNSKAVVNMVTVYTLESILKEHLNRRKIILKVDIEGAEKGLFSNIDNWPFLTSFDLVIVELHDWMLPGDGSSLPFLHWNVENNRDVCIHGMNIFSFKRL